MLQPGAITGAIPGAPPTKVLCLSQIVAPDELKDDEEFEDIMEDMRQEGGKFGINLNSYCLVVQSDYTKSILLIYLCGLYVSVLQPILVTHT